MSNKNLLNENTVRRFMKLAEIEPLTDQFVGKINEGQHMRKDDEDRKDDDLEEGMRKDDDLEEGQHMRKDDDLEEGMGMRKDDDLEMHLPENFDFLDEELDSFLDEVGDVSMQDDDDEPLGDELEDEPVGDELEDEPMGPAPEMGGLDMDALGEMIEDAVMNALESLVDSGKLSVDVDKEEDEVDLSEMDHDRVEDDDKMMNPPPMMEEEEDMVNEVARRVMKRIINSRR